MSVPVGYWVASAVVNLLAYRPGTAKTACTSGWLAVLRLESSMLQLQVRNPPCVVDVSDRRVPQPFTGMGRPRAFVRLLFSATHNADSKR